MNELNTPDFIPEDLPPDLFSFTVEPLNVRIASILDEWEGLALDAALGPTGLGGVSKPSPRWTAHFDLESTPTVAAEGDGYVRWGSGRVAFVEMGPEDLGRARALHIAAWDPERVRAIIAMARDILAIHRPVTRFGSELDQSCEGCRITIVTHAPAMDERPREVACSSLITLARMLSVPI